MNRKERYTAYFQALVNEMERYGWVSNQEITGKNHHHFASGFTGIKYSARFPKTETVQTYLLLRFEDGETTQNFFDVLIERESKINARFRESEFDEPLCWDRCDNIEAPKTSRIYIECDGTIETHASELEAFRAWHVKNLLKFKEVFTPEIQRARETLQSR